MALIGWLQFDNRLATAGGDLEPDLLGTIGGVRNRRFDHADEPEGEEARLASALVADGTFLRVAVADVRSVQGTVLAAGRSDHQLLAAEPVLLGQRVGR